MISLPSCFQEIMQKMLEEEYPVFLRCYEQPPYRAVRTNLLKCTIEKLHELLPFPLKKTPFSPYSFYIPDASKGVGSHPLHHAGAFYVQEPSAASAVTVLDPQPGEKILDLCAAPGGKSTQIAAQLQGKGLLWSNEVNKGRARILLSNMERMGVRNAVVSCCSTEVLCERLTGFFDRVLVDAPCSGEGMFRREPQAVTEWSVQNTQACAVRQNAILHTAAQAVKQGGVLVYSTCTFSLQENEGVVVSFLKEHPGFVLEDCNVDFGREAFSNYEGAMPALTKARRIFPMDGGEGHFVAKLRRESENQSCVSIYPYEKTQDSVVKASKELFEQLFTCPAYGQVAVFDTMAVLLPSGLPALSGLGVLRAGVMLGEVKKSYVQRIQPAHALFMAAQPYELRSVLDLACDDSRLSAFLRGEEIQVEDSFSGYTGVAVHGILTGFGKCSNGVMKNHYPKGLRNNA